MVFNDLILICLHLCSWPCLAIQIEVLTIWKKINSYGQHIENSSLTTSIRLLILLGIYHLWYACWHQWVYNNCQWIKQFLGIVKACDFFIIYINSSQSCITRRKKPIISTWNIKFWNDSNSSLPSKFYDILYVGMCVY